MRIAGTFHTLRGEAQPSPQFNDTYKSTTTSRHATGVPTGAIAFTIRLATIALGMNATPFADPGDGVTNRGRI